MRECAYVLEDNYLPLDSFLYAHDRVIAACRVPFHLMCSTYLPRLVQIALPRHLHPSRTITFETCQQEVTGQSQPCSTSVHCVRIGAVSQQRSGDIIELLRDRVLVGHEIHRDLEALKISTFVVRAYVCFSFSR